MARPPPPDAMSLPSLRCTAFADQLRIASGELRHVALKAKQAHDRGRQVRVFEDASGRSVELPLALPEAELLRWLAEPRGLRAGAVRAPRGPGRPRLGVVAREVTLLPQHWDWLAVQPGGASVALRRLVEQARVAAAGERRGAAREATWRFLQAMARELPGCEAAGRALFAGDFCAFHEHIQRWPEDIREHAAVLAADAFTAS